MIGYQFTLCCRWCGGPVEHVTNGTPQMFDTRAIAQCVDCRTRWLVTVTLSDPSGGRSQRTAAKSASIVRARAAKVAS